MSVGLNIQLPFEQSNNPYIDYDKNLQHRFFFCLLYTSDAADERSSVDLGGRRIIKKKKKNELHGQCIIEEQRKTIRTHLEETQKTTTGEI